MSGKVMRPCEEIEPLLIEGILPAEDPELAEHVRSCLRCFRTAADLRDIPAIAGLLEQESRPDPGAVFWAEFPVRLADRWDREHGRAHPTRMLWTRVGAAARLSLPSAFAGAALAAALMLMWGKTAADRGQDAPPAAAKERLVGESEAVAKQEPALWELGEVFAQMSQLNDDIWASPPSDELETGPSPTEELEMLEGEALEAVAQALRVRGI